MIEARGLTKRYGTQLAVNDLTFTVPAGEVTGFLGPNGAGKSTTMRLILGLDVPSAGVVTIGGRRYGTLGRPLREVGALLDANALHPGRTARDHLRCLALSNRIAPSRVSQVLDQVGLASVAGKRTGGFSLGMKQRLGIAAALLGDPSVLIFDEPINGLDPEGVVWVRTLLKALASEGRTVLLSSHLMSEMALTADRLLILGRGKLLADTSLTSLLAEAGSLVRVRASQSAQLASLLAHEGYQVQGDDDFGVLQVTRAGDASSAEALAENVGQIARVNGLALQELSVQRVSLEERYMSITADAVDFHAGGSLAPSPGVERAL